MKGPLAESDPLNGAERLERLLTRCEADRSQHMTGGGCAESDLVRLEMLLGQPLPGPLRIFLRRLGGGVYYMKHEIFGTHRVMIHDIELLPDIFSFREWLAIPRADWLPIHRYEGRTHAVQLGVPDPAPVLDLENGALVYQDFTALLETLVRR